MRRLPPLSALPAFEATARLGSVTAAANELGRTHGAISKQIRQLSDDLGGGLFEKCGNGLKLTARGERLLRSVTPLLDEIGELSLALRTEIEGRPLVIGASATLTSRWLTKRLPRLYELCHGREVRILTTGQIKVPDHEIDILLSYDRLRGKVRHDDHISLGDAYYGPVCAPGHEVERRQERWFTPTRLVQIGASHSWNTWQNLSGIKLDSTRLVEHAHHFLALEAAAAGLGVALAEERLVRADIASGRLVAPLGFTRVAGGFQAMIMQRARGCPFVATVVDWLISEAGQ